MQTNSLKICILTSVHTRYDVRIFIKQARSFVKAGCRTSLIVADGQGNEIIDGVIIFDVGRRSSNRFGRFSKTVIDVCKKAIKLDSDIYHFHDAELIPIGLLLRMLGKKVIYDVHEDLPRQILGKHYIPPIIRKIVALGVEFIENLSTRYFTAIFTATPYICHRFKKKRKEVYDINNYPILSEMYCPEIKWNNRLDKVCYIGGISEIRGIKQVIDAMGKINCRLDLAGPFSPESLRDKMVLRDGWSNVNELGVVDRDQVKKILSECQVGVVCFLPLENHINAQPNKMFEYMSAGIPVVGSNFPLWRQILEKNNCGICVNPQDPEAIAKAINTLLCNPELAAKMGKNGKKIVDSRYNWEKESVKMLSLYSKFLSN